MAQLAIPSNLDPWRRPALCRRCYSLHLSAWKVELGRAGPNDAVVRVALGGYADGAIEVLGVWASVGSAQPAWKLIARDLLSRGLEATTFVVGGDSEVGCWLRGRALPSPLDVIRRAALVAGGRSRSAAIQSLLRDASSTGVGSVSFAKLIVGAFNCKSSEGLQASLWALGELSPLLSLASRQRRVILAAEAASAEAGRCVELGTYPSVDLVEDRANSLVVGALRRTDRRMARRMQVEERAQYSSMP